MNAALLCLLALGQTPAEGLADYERHPEADRAHIRYLRLPAPAGGNAGPGANAGGGAADRKGINWAGTTAFVVCSNSLRFNLNEQAPWRVNDTLVGIDLRGLGWTWQNWVHVMKRYPYSPNENPLSIRADWLIHELSDSSESDSYLRLLFGGDSQPKNRDLWLSGVGVERDKIRSSGLDFGYVETSSGVALQKIRQIEFLQRYAGYASGTKDYFEVTADNSPLEQIDGKNLKHDGEEWIVGVPKRWHADPKRGIGTTGRGALQVYLLADGKGAIVKEAPVRLVEDTTRFKNRAALVFPGSCIQCHDTGLNAPTQNGLIAWLKSGVELKTKKEETRRYLERFHLTDTGKTISRANEDYGDAVKALTGQDAKDNAASYKAAILDYLAPVDLQRAAAELETTTEDLRRALAYANESGADIGGTLAALVSNQAMPRKTWESLYLRSRKYLRNWEASKDEMAKK